jgi:hypothetical protein
MRKTSLSLSLSLSLSIFALDLYLWSIHRTHRGQPILAGIPAVTAHDGPTMVKPVRGDQFPRSEVADPSGGDRSKQGRPIPEVGGSRSKRGAANPRRGRRFLRSAEMRTMAPFERFPRSGREETETEMGWRRGGDGARPDDGQPPRRRGGARRRAATKERRGHNGRPTVALQGRSGEGQRQRCEIGHGQAKDGGCGNPTCSDTMLGIDNLVFHRGQKP